MAKDQAQSIDTKSSKAAATATAPKAEKGTASTDGKAAPRPRKFDYGIYPENKVAVIKPEGEVKLKAAEQEGYDVAMKSCTVQTFLEKSNRSVLRRLSRKNLVQITAPDGTTFPCDYVAPEPKPKKEKAEKAA